MLTEFSGNSAARCTVPDNWFEQSNSKNKRGLGETTTQHREAQIEGAENSMHGAVSF